MDHSFVGPAWYGMVWPELASLNEVLVCFSKHARHAMQHKSE